MAKVIELHVWIQNKKETWKEPEVVNRFGKEQRGKRIVLEIADNTSIAEMKIEVAKVIDKRIKELRYYYVVAVVQREDGQVGYRTIVPKTIVS